MIVPVNRTKAKTQRRRQRESEKEWVKRKENAWGETKTEMERGKGIAGMS